MFLIDEEEEDKEVIILSVGIVGVGKKLCKYSMFRE